MYNAFKTIAADLLNNGINDRYQQYFNEFKGELTKEALTKEEFCRDYHREMNYLFKFMKMILLNK
jgi:hypothetical protein